MKTNRKAKANNAKKPLISLLIVGLLFILLAVLFTSHYGEEAASPPSSGETSFTEAETVTDSNKADTNVRKPQALGEHPKPVVMLPKIEADGSHPQAA